MKRPSVALSAIILAMSLYAGGARAESIWTVGIYTGESPFHLSAPEGVTNPVLKPADVTDMDATTLAHPFMAVTDSLYYMFFTVKNLGTGEGGIGLAESRDGLDWKYRRIVVDEPYDLAYPYVFKWRDEYYMIPEAHTETSVRLYKATDFPTGWKYEGDLVTGDHFISASIVLYQDTWWMFVARSGNETLRLLYADDFRGPWTEHPQSPIIEKDLNIARPGGRPLVIDGSLYRICQDCYPTYGNQVFAFRVTEISRTAYKERMIETPLMKATSKGWNAEAMHHVDAHQISKNRWIAAVDALGR